MNTQFVYILDLKNSSGKWKMMMGIDSTGQTNPIATINNTAFLLLRIVLEMEVWSLTLL